jgi:hypothetical protein
VFVIRTDSISVAYQLIEIERLLGRVAHTVFKEEDSSSEHGSAQRLMWPRRAKDHQWIRHGGQPAVRDELEFEEHYRAGTPDRRGLGIPGKLFGAPGAEPDRLAPEAIVDTL